MTRILICGDRNWKDVETIENFVRSLPPDTVILHGDGRGADRIADKAAKEHGLNVETFSAKWETYGKAAGPIRNRRARNRVKEPTKAIKLMKNVLPIIQNKGLI